MQRGVWCAVAVMWAGLACAADGKVSTVQKAPAGVSEKVAGAITASGVQVTIGGGEVCTVWLAKDLPGKAGFQPSLNVKYPFTPGQLVGVLEVQQKSDFTDFRGQDVKPGVYTLRYAQQPVDGNHVGTSELHDFLLAVPVKTDTDPALMASADDLNRKSAATTGANHPAIYSLLPVEGSPKAAALEHDEGKEQWVLTLIGASAGKPLVLRLVVVGKSEG